jgi:hypothetical protein
VVNTGEVIVCTPVNVFAASVRAIVAEVEGNVIVVESVPSNVILLLNVRVLPATPVSVYVPVVKVLPFILVAVATPRTGVTNVKLVNVIFAAGRVPVTLDVLSEIGVCTHAVTVVSMVTAAVVILQVDPEYVVPNLINVVRNRGACVVLPLVYQVGRAHAPAAVTQGPFSAPDV